ncbi:MAG: response regulator transcription factor [Nitrospirae bacterium]|nr:response regulator transcription factor [Nitrospirota bacterium]
MKILIADDHAIVRRGLKLIIQETSPKIAVDEAADWQEVIDRVLKTVYDMILMEISMHGINGLEVLKQIKKCKPSTRVLVLTTHSEEQYAIRALKAGADGYLTKSGSPEELICCIKKIMTGKKCVSSSLAEELACYIENGGAKHPHELLSDREFEIMRMIASGKKMTEIAGDLSLSIKTISTYRSRILYKMNFRNNAELINYVLQNLQGK